MFHGVMVALEFLVLSVIVRIGVEQHPLPPRVLRIFFPALAQDSFFLAVSFLDTAFLVFFRPFLPPPHAPLRRRVPFLPNLHAREFADCSFNV